MKKYASVLTLYFLICIDQASAQNTFYGGGTGSSTTTGNNNSFFGESTGVFNTSGNENVLIGKQAGYANQTGSLNVSVGTLAGFSNRGSQNTFIGGYAGGKNVSWTGSGNVFLGYGAGYNETGSNKLYVDNSDTSTPLIWGDFDMNFVNVNGKVGIGTTFPNATLDVISSSGYPLKISSTHRNVIGMTNNGWLNSWWLVNDSNGSFALAENGTTDRFTITPGGNVGIGTSSPGATLEVVGTSYPQMIIRNPSGHALPRLIGNNEVGFLLNSTVGGSEWEVATGWYGAYRGPDAFFFYKNGASRFEIDSNGDVVMTGNVGIAATSPSYKLQVQNAYCDGNTWYNASDISLKENFVEIKKGESILARLNKLPIQYWNYKGEKSRRHIGPTAQDFHKIFNLGDNEKAISTVDESGIALAAIQELSHETQQLKNVLSEQQVQLKEQQQLIASLLQSKSENLDQLAGTESGLKLYQNQPDTKITMEIPIEVNQAVLFIYDLQGKAIDQQTIY